MIQEQMPTQPIQDDHIGDDHPEWMAAREFLLSHAGADDKSTPQVKPQKQIAQTAPPNPIQLRQAAMERFGFFVAMQGMPPKAVTALADALQSVPLLGFSAFIQRAVFGLQSRQLYFGATDETAFLILEDQTQPGFEHAQPDLQLSTDVVAQPADGGGYQPSGGLGDMGSHPDGTGGGMVEPAPALSPGGEPVAPMGDGSAPDNELNEAPADDIGEAPHEGEPIAPSDGAAQPPNEALGAQSDGMTPYGPEVGGMGVPSAEMPVISSSERDAVVEFVKSQGVQCKDVQVKAGDLKPAEDSFSFDKVQAAKDFTGPESPILISADNVVLDGQHQWLNKLAYNEPVSAIQFDAPMADLLPILAAYKEQSQSAQPSDSINAEETSPVATAPDEISGGALRSVAPDTKQPEAVAPADTPPVEASPAPHDPFADDYKAFEGKTLTQQVKVAGTGQTATMRRDAASALRSINEREKSLLELKKCLGGRK